jgi:hypothetical protein
MRIPPKRPQPQPLRRMFAPADVTETARQGQGIGDVEAMRQMAVTAVPEILRNLPGTSTPMSALDAALAAGRKDYPGAAMAALGAVPFAGALKYADEARDAARAVRSALPMDEASRMARAAEQGFTVPVYHATTSTTPFDVIRQSNSPMMDLNAVHVGTKKTANDRAGAVSLLSVPSGLQFQSAKVANRRRGWMPEGLEERQDYLSRENIAPSILPLMMKAEKPYLNPATGSPFTEKEFMRHVGEWTRKNAPDLAERDYLSAKQLMKRDLLEQGYDVVPYVNDIEGGPRPKSGRRGDISYMVLRPENIRSRFAKFDPANIGKAGLMGGLAAVLAGQRNQEQRDEP